MTQKYVASPEHIARGVANHQARLARATKIMKRNAGQNPVLAHSIPFLNRKQERAYFKRLQLKGVSA